MSLTRRAESVFRIRKPRGAIAKYWAEQHGQIKGQPRPPVERRLLSWIADNADLLDVPAPRLAPPSVPDGWLLVPAPRWVLDELAALYAEREDHEPDADLEVNGDFEEGADDEDGGEDELTVVRPETMDRAGLPDSDEIATPAQRARWRARPYDSWTVQDQRVRKFLRRR